MTRRLYNIAVVTSLVLFFVVMGLWIVSGFYSVDVGLARVGGGNFVVAQSNGYLVAGWELGPPYRPAAFYCNYHRLLGFDMIPPILVYGDANHATWLGLGYAWYTSTYGVFIPHWLLAILMLILPVVWLIRRRRKHDPDAVPCAKCGYDLRGSPGGACPECGQG